MKPQNTLNRNISKTEDNISKNERESSIKVVKDNNEDINRINKAILINNNNNNNNNRDLLIVDKRVN